MVTLTNPLLTIQSWNCPPGGHTMVKLLVTRLLLRMAKIPPSRQVYSPVMVQVLPAILVLCTPVMRGRALIPKMLKDALSVLRMRVMSPRFNQKTSQ